MDIEKLMGKVVKVGTHGFCKVKATQRRPFGLPTPFSGYYIYIATPYAITLPPGLVCSAALDMK